MSDSKKIVLTIAERFTLTGILDSYKGGMTGLASILNDIKEVIVSEDEKKAMNFRIEPENPKEGEVQKFKWDQPAPDKEVSFEQPTLDYVLQFIKDKDEKGEVTLSDIALLSLKEKIEK